MSGLALPETTEELYQVLKAFKDQDPRDTLSSGGFGVLSPEYGRGQVAD